MCGVNYKTLMAQFSRKSRIPYDTVDDLTLGLDLPHGYFSRYSPSLSVTSEHDSAGLSVAAAQLMDAAMHTAHLEALRKQSQLSIMDVLNWLRQTNWEVKSLGALKDRVDLFRVMTSGDRIPDPYQIGPNSLSTKEFELLDEDHYRRLFSELDPNFLDTVKTARIAASSKEFVVEFVELRIEIGGREAAVNYWRLIAKVFLPKNEELTLVFAEPAPSILPSNRG